MKIEYKKLSEIKPYKNNPRINENAVPYVMESIRQYGFKVPIVVDKNNIIITGHTRFLASERLGLEKVPVIVASDLSEEQANAFRLADNKVSEQAKWDIDKLEEELKTIDNKSLMEAIGFDIKTIEEEIAEDEEESTKIECPKCGYIGEEYEFDI